MLHCLLEIAQIASIDNCTRCDVLNLFSDVVAFTAENDERVIIF